MKIQSDSGILLGVMLGVIIGAVGFYVVAKTNQLCYSDSSTTPGQGPIINWICKDKITRLNNCNSALSKYKNAPNNLGWTISNTDKGIINVTGITGSVSNIAAIYYDSDQKTILAEVGCAPKNNAISTVIPTYIPFPTYVSFAIKDKTTDFVLGITKKQVIGTVNPILRICGVEVGTDLLKDVTEVPLKINLNIAYSQRIQNTEGLFKYDYYYQSYPTFEAARDANIQDGQNTPNQLGIEANKQNITATIQVSTTLPKKATQPAPKFFRIFINSNASYPTRTIISMANQIIIVGVMNSKYFSFVIEVDKNINNDQYNFIFKQTHTSPIIQ